jgi:hypothetical protein
MQSLLTLADFEPVAWIFGLGIFGILLSVAALAVWIWALVHAIRNPALDDMMRIVWVLVIIFAPLVGMILYALLAPKGGSVTPTTYHHG